LFKFFISSNPYHYHRLLFSPFALLFPPYYYSVVSILYKNNTGTGSEKRGKIKNTDIIAFGFKLTIQSLEGWKLRKDKEREREKKKERCFYSS